MPDAMHDPQHSSRNVLRCSYYLDRLKHPDPASWSFVVRGNEPERTKIRIHWLSVHFIGDENLRILKV